MSLFSTVLRVIFSTRSNERKRVQEAGFDLSFHGTSYQTQLIGLTGNCTIDSPRSHCTIVDLCTPLETSKNLDLLILPLYNLLVSYESLLNPYHLFTPLSPLPSFNASYLTAYNLMLQTDKCLILL